MRAAARIVGACLAGMDAYVTSAATRYGPENVNATLTDMSTPEAEIWHNPRCSKSRAALAHLDATGTAYSVRRYLDEPPSAAELRAVLQRLGAEPWDIARTGEDIAAELGLAEWGRTPADRERWITALAEHPRLIQRPIVFAADGRAVVARDPDALRSLD